MAASRGRKTGENHDSSGACPLAYIQCLGQGRASLLEEGYLHQPLRTGRTEAAGQAGQLLSGLPGVEAAPPDQDNGDIRFTGPGGL